MNTAEKIVTILDLLATTILVPTALYGLITNEIPLFAGIVMLLVASITAYLGGSYAGRWWKNWKGIEAQ